MGPELGGGFYRLLAEETFALIKMASLIPSYLSAYVESINTADAMSLRIFLEFRYNLSYVCCMPACVVRINVGQLLHSCHLR